MRNFVAEMLALVDGNECGKFLKDTRALYDFLSAEKMLGRNDLNNLIETLSHYYNGNVSGMQCDIACGGYVAGTKEHYEKLLSENKKINLIVPYLKSITECYSIMDGFQNKKISITVKEFYT
jgi:hypothetical protein